jgi:hypothetical protein
VRLTGIEDAPLTVTLTTDFGRKTRNLTGFSRILAHFRDPLCQSVREAGESVCVAKKS